MRADPRLRDQQHGFTLIEALVVVAVLSILAAVATMRGLPQAGRSSAGQQAERVADEVRQAQAMAMAWGRNLRFVASAGSYAITCVPTSDWRGGVDDVKDDAPCVDDTVPIDDPVRGAPAAATLEGGLMFESALSLQFDTLGRLVGADAPAKIHLSFAEERMATVRVEPGSGHVSIEVLR